MQKAAKKYVSSMNVELFEFYLKLPKIVIDITRDFIIIAANESKLMAYVSCYQENVSY